VLIEETDERKSPVKAQAPPAEINPPTSPPALFRACLPPNKCGSESLFLSLSVHLQAITAAHTMCAPHSQTLSNQTRPKT
jgi:hypothetical protein